MKKNKPSATASLILKTILFASKDPQKQFLISNDTLRWSESIARRISRYPRILFYALSSKLFQFLFKLTDRIFNPGYILHVVSRKNFIDYLGQQIINQGIQQVIVVGAGYDTFSIRKSRLNPNVKFFEIDYPTTQELKVSSIEKSEIPENIYFIPADLSVTSISSVLKAHSGFNQKLATLFLIEGVLMYLDPQSVETFFKEILKLVNSNMTCIFTFMHGHDNKNIHFKDSHPLINAWLKQKEEQLLWCFDKNEIGNYLKKLGFTKTSVYGKDDFIAKYFHNRIPQPMLAEGEYIGVTKV